MQNRYCMRTNAELVTDTTTILHKKRREMNKKDLKKK